MEMLFKVSTQITGALFKPGVLNVFNKEFRKGLLESSALVKYETAMRTPVSSGMLRKSYTMEVTGSGLDMRGIVGTNLGYAAPVELGAEPHFPPVEKIELWIQRKGITPMVGGVEVGIRKLAFVIARSISHRGFNAVAMLDKAFNASRSRILSILNSCNARVVEALQ